MTGFPLNHVPGAVNLSSVLQLLREAHCSVCHCQQQLQQQEQQQQQQHQQLRSQHQNTSPAQPTSYSSTPSDSQAVWHMLAPLLAWPDHISNTNKRWCGALRPTCWRPRPQLQQQQQQHGGLPAKHSTESKSSSAPSTSSTARPSVDNTSSDDNGCHHNSSGVLPGLLQHLLGLLAALLFIYWQEHLLRWSAVAGTWLQHRVLQPHIAWLREAHPGGQNTPAAAASAVGAGHVVVSNESSGSMCRSCAGCIASSCLMV